VLRIGILRTLPTAPLAALLRSFKHEHPEILIELYDGPADELRRRMLENKFDISLSMIEDDADPAECIALFTESYVVLTNKSHRFASRASVSLDDLNDEPFIVRTSCETYESTTKVLLARGIRTHVVYRTDQDDRVLGLVAAGVGIALLPAIYCSDVVAATSISDFTGQRTIGIKWKPDAVSDAQNSFVSFAQNHRWVMS
jgi:DNA-binding transcriptional LysR family regulator